MELIGEVFNVGGDEVRKMIKERMERKGMIKSTRSERKKGLNKDTKSGAKKDAKKAIKKDVKKEEEKEEANEETGE